MNELEPVETKICRACGNQKKLKSFGKTSSGNRGNVCNICKSLGNTIKKGVKGEHYVVKNNVLQLGNVSIDDYIKVYKFLKSIDYDLSQDIHIQFCKKYGLTPNSPKQTFKNHYSQKDCGLV